MSTLLDVPNTTDLAVVAPDFESLSRADLIALCRTQYDLTVELKALLEQQAKRISELEASLQQLQQPPSTGAGLLPSFVKPNAPRKEKTQPRKKRTQSFSRRRSSDRPTSIVQHAAQCCPDCGRKLTGGWLHRSREVIEVAPCPIQIVEHQLIGRWCGVCQKRVLPQVDAPEQVFGVVGKRRRVGIALMSWVGVLHTVARVPLRTVQHLLELLFNVHLGVGELSEILHAVAGKGASRRAELFEQVRGSPFVHADETGWRENGQNGYLWSFSTPDVRCFVYNKSRSGEVAEQALGERFGADPDKPDQVLVSDFYSGYHRFICRHQRCWVHLLRDLRKLREAYPHNGALAEWIAAVRVVYDKALAYQKRCRVGESLDCSSVLDRRRKRKELEDELLLLIRPHLPAKRPRKRGEPQDDEAPDTPSSVQCVLAERMSRHLSELFTFVEFPAVPSENNAAERSLRPAVIARKISGGTRSERGSDTKTALMSLLGTWAVQGKDPLNELRSMLATAV